MNIVRRQLFRAMQLRFMHCNDISCVLLQPQQINIPNLARTKYSNTGRTVFLDLPWIYAVQGNVRRVLPKNRQ